MHHFAIAVVNENPTMHYFGISRHIKSMIAYNILMEYFWKFQWKLHYLNVTNSSPGIVLEQEYHAKLESAGKRSLGSFGPAVWNSLSVDLGAICEYGPFKGH